jgi:xanthine dehydrogenase accessory factor
MNTLKIWQFILTKLQNNIAVAFLVVPQSVGSSPGRQGHFMAVAADHSMCGTVGGGAMEYIQVEASKKHLKNGRKEHVYQRLVHEKTLDSEWSGLSCSGEQTILSYFLYNKDAGLIERILDNYSQNSCCLICYSDGRLICQEVAEQRQRYAYTFIDKTQWSFCFKVNQKERIFLVGAGHVGQALCRQLYLLDFEIILLDNRKDLPTEAVQSFIDQKVICNYKKVANFVSSTYLDYIVIMSFSSALDQLILSQLIHKPFKYIGMMASLSKVQRIRASLIKKGFDAALLNKLHSPIGLSLPCKSPAEIAVSVAAQLIQIRNQVL